MRRLPAIVPVVALLVAGCSGVRYGRATLPAGLSGPAPPIAQQHSTAIDPERVRLTREYFAIHHPALAAALPPGEGAEAIAFVPWMVVVHWTAIPTLEGTLEAFAPVRLGEDREAIGRHGALNVGIQFVVDRDGAIYSLYPETAMARHTIGLNHVAIGIENVGDGDLGDRAAAAPLTEAQLLANVALVRHLAAKYPTIDYLIGHREYRDVERQGHPAHALFYEALPGYRTEKVDPGRRFLRRLRQALREG